MLGRRGFFGALAACFAWMLPFKRPEAVAYWGTDRETLSEGAGPLGDEDGNTVFGFNSGVKAGVKNAVVVGVGSIAEKSNVVILGNEKTESLIFGDWEFTSDENGPLFVNRRAGRIFRLIEIVKQSVPNGVFGEHALICGGPECPAGMKRSERTLSKASEDNEG